MVGRVLALMLVASAALAQDHQMYQAQTPELVGYPNWVLTPSGRERIAGKLQSQAETIARREVEAQELRERVLELSAQPTLTWTGALALVGVGIVLGLAVGIPVALAAKR